MSSKNSKDNDMDLFQQAMADVTPLKYDGIEPQHTKPEATPKQRLLDDEQVMLDAMHQPIAWDQVETGHELNYHVDSISKKTIRRLRQGKYKVHDDLDLHHLNKTDAKKLILDFIELCLAENKTCIKIIHGKGHHSSNDGPVIKPLVDQLLRQHKNVVAFSSAKLIDGGTGAVYVLLKK